MALRDYNAQRWSLLDAATRHRANDRDGSARAPTPCCRCALCGPTRCGSGGPGRRSRRQPPSMGVCRYRRPAPRWTSSGRGGLGPPNSGPPSRYGPPDLCPPRPTCGRPHLRDLVPRGNLGRSRRRRRDAPAMAVHPGAVGANGAAAVLTAPRKVDEHAAAEYAATQLVGALGPKSRARALCYRASNP